VRIEVVPVGAEDAGEAVSRVGNLDLDAGQTAGKKGAEETRARGGRVERRLAAQQRRPARRQLCLKAVLDVAVNEVVIVVAGKEDQSR